MILPIILWYLIITLLGWLTFPLAYRLLPALADRGYALSRTLGWLLWGYIFWLLASLGVLQNNPGGLLFALVLLIGLSLWSLRKASADEIFSWLRSKLKLIVFVELVFLISFSAMVVIRAANPEILGTEKPMELAFINAILHSPTFPPHDPWLSGYAISYYYFGYVLVALLAKLSGTAGGIAFNLGISTVFALSAVGVYGIVYDLLAVRKKASDVALAASHNLSLPLLGPLFILLLGNMEGFLQVLHTRGLFWRTNADGQMVSGFWQWLDILDLNQPPAQPFSWIPTRFWWWWRASRVLQDYDFAGSAKEIIDEFPAFSYILADLHPHVLAMPFAFLGMALVLNLLLGGGHGRLDWSKWRVRLRTIAWLALILICLGFMLVSFGLNGSSLRVILFGFVCLGVGGVGLIYLLQPISQYGLAIFTRGDTDTRQVGISIDINFGYLLFSAVVLGGMAFLNTWDFPLYVALYAAGYLVFRYVRSMRKPEYILETGNDTLTYSISNAVRDYIVVGLLLGVTGFILYLPFYLSFSSQAGGILPSLVYVTRGAHLWVMFGLLLIPIALYLIYLWNTHGSRSKLRKSAGWVIGGSLIMLLLSILLGFAIVQIPMVRDLFLANFAAPGITALIGETLRRWLVNPGAWITLIILLIITVALLWPGKSSKLEGQPDHRWLYPGASFALLLILFGGLLVLGTEFFFLRDQFGWRMNTIFKFYYQTWLMWGTAAAFGSAALILELSVKKKLVFEICLVLIIAIGLTYSVLGIWNKTEGFAPAQGWSLDGTMYLERQSPDEMAAINWLANAPQGVVAEAVGGSYSAYGRISMISGQPAVLGWPGHESQWRGGSKEMGSRQSDIQRLYCSREWESADAIIQQYDIRYIFIGGLERSTYTPQTCGTGLFEQKFFQHLTPVFQQGDVTIYEAR